MHYCTMRKAKPTTFIALFCDYKLIKLFIRLYNKLIQHDFINKIQENK